MNEHLSPIESIMWRVGQDPTLRMTVGALMLLDRSPGTAALGEQLSAAAERAPRLRQRPDDLTFTRLRPEWIDDDDLDVGHHVRTVAIAAPGSMRQVLDLVALFEAIPFDPEHPPWDATLIEGLEGGRAALYFRAHHVVTDGLGGLRLTGALLDEVGWPRSLQAQPPTKDRKRTRRRDRRPTTVTIDLTKATEPLRRRVNAARDVEPVDTVVRGLQRALDVANSVSRQVMVTGGPLSPLFDDHSMMSRFEVFSVPRARGMRRARSAGAGTISSSRRRQAVSASTTNGWECRAPSFVSRRRRFTAGATKSAATGSSRRVLRFRPAPDIRDPCSAWSRNGSRRLAASQPCG